MRIIIKNKGDSSLEIWVMIEKTGLKIQNEQRLSSTINHYF